MFFVLLYSSTDKDLHQLPEQWLQSLLDELTSDTPLQALCGTRRSAGVPFFIQVSIKGEHIQLNHSTACFSS